MARQNSGCRRKALAGGGRARRRICNYHFELHKGACKYNICTEGGGVLLPDIGPKEGSSCWIWYIQYKGILHIFVPTGMNATLSMVYMGQTVRNIIKILLRHCRVDMFPPVHTKSKF